MTRARPLAVLLVAAVALIAAAPAGAVVQRYASPTGTGTACVVQFPCSYQEAITGVDPGGTEVILAPGDYGSADDPITGNVFTMEQADVHGVAGGPRPRIFSSAGFALGLYDTASTVRHVEVRLAPPGAVGLDFSGITAEDVIVRSTATSGTGAACYINEQAVMRNSLCWSQSSDALRVYGNFERGPNDVTLRNVTAVSLASNGLLAFTGNKTSEVTAVNTIFQGSPGIKTYGSATQVTRTHSNVIGGQDTASGGTISANATNLVAAAQFVPGLGDLHQAFGSPTINRGTNADTAGQTDPDGQPRVVGGTADIGADEFVPPGATSGGASKVTRVSARLSGGFNARNVPGARARFEYGPTTSYGTKTAPQALGASNASQSRAAQIGGLAIKRTYHYRAVLEGPAGTARGADRTFKTLPPFPGLGIPKQTVTVRQGTARVKTRCRTAVGSCRGTLKLTRDGKQIGKAGFDVAPGKRKRIPVPLSEEARARLKDAGELTAKARSKAFDDVGATATRTRKLTLHRPEPKPATAASNGR